MMASRAIKTLYLNILMQGNSVAEFYRENFSFVRKTAKVAFLSHHLRTKLGITYAIYL